MTTYKLLFYLILSSTLTFFECHNLTKPRQEKYKNEIMKVELDFARMAEEKGVKEAFLFFADDSAALNRNGKIIKGKEQIAQFFDASQIPEGFSLSWTPDFVDVSDDGSMAYTFGGFVMTMLDSAGNKVSQKGIFNTIWKRRKDGKWRYVYD